jgi:hypothetical protein
MTAVAGSESFSFSRVIERLFGVLGRNIATFALLSVLLVGLPSGILQFLQLSAAAPPAGGVTALPLTVGLGLVGLVASWIGNAALQAAVIHASVSDLSGRKADFGECLATGLRFFLPLFFIGMIVGVCCFVGAIFFIAPGVILGLVWFVAAPVEVVERKGVFGALGRSLNLTRNHRVAIFGLCLIYLIAAGVLWFVLLAFTAAGSIGAIGIAGTENPGAGTLVRALVSLIANALFGSVSAAGLAAVYFELRQAKEGVGVEQLASVFD